MLCDGNEIKATFPYSDASEFEQRPQLLCTNPAENKFIDHPDFLYERTADWSLCEFEQPSLFCMTDALGQWLLHMERPGTIPYRDDPWAEKRERVCSFRGRRACIISDEAR